MIFINEYQSAPKNNNTTPNTDAPNADAPNYSDDDDAYPYSLCNSKNKKNNRTTSTDAPKNYAPDTAADDATSPESLILDSSLKRKTNPKSTLTGTDDNYATDNAFTDAINTSPHAKNSATDPDAAASKAENNASVRQLIDGQEHPIAEGDIIKKEFYHKSAVEQCMAYLHGIDQLLGCPSYTSDRLLSCTC